MTLNQHLNKQVANMAVFYFKLRHYHYYVKGPEFFKLHEKFEELFDEVTEMLDSFAERLIMVGGKPASNMKNYLELTSLVEATETCPTDMVKSVVADLKALADEFKVLIDVAEKADDPATADMVTAFVFSFDKHTWMFSATIAK